ncbi:kinesin-like protein KIN-UA [Selaginella moellendorffii]|uniref:kinesin-like protein KIN-UA n=1 Tax=Selaginella moellendorffii TaxID=88036 RepID=UPI000D1CB5D8|nr:kinesin-like protein KIN-UA [Selaginella moellendorffii]|eukprot:XP_024526430.1 kinesin-like protein KIN-UA [Selaginella moellendorffii]
MKSGAQSAAAAAPTTSATSMSSRPRSASLSAPRRSSAGKNDGGARVRVAVRLRPRNAEELVADADFPDGVELQPELKRLKLRKNNWDSETYQFDEVFPDTASQKRVYEVVAKPVVESVLDGYNGTVMAYGQTGTGKTYTLGKLGEEDCADRGIMVRALEDIMADTNPENDTVCVSYLQLYMESIQDLLAPERDNIPIAEDPKTGDVSLPGATLIQLKNYKSFIGLLQTGEANRVAANTKLNTESSRSHAVLLVYIKKHVKAKESSNENGSRNSRAPVIRRSKLLIVDLAGSERVDKSGSEGITLEEAKFINLSLTALGKCINALAENSPHVPTRDSKLTRLLRDSFGGSARTSLITTIGPSPRHRGETASTILFGQRAMKVENMLKLKEEFDYKSLCRRLEADLDKLIVENERHVKAVVDAEEELHDKLNEARSRVAEAEGKLASALGEMSLERSRYQKDTEELRRQALHHVNDIKSLEKKLEENAAGLNSQKEREIHAERIKHEEEITNLADNYKRQNLNLSEQLQIERTLRLQLEEELSAVRSSSKQVPEQCVADQLTELKERLDKERLTRENLELELRMLQNKENYSTGSTEAIKEKQNEEILNLKKKLDEESKQRKKREEEIRNLRYQLAQSNEDAEIKRIEKGGSGRSSFGSDSPLNLHRPNILRDTINGQRATIAKLFEQVGLQKILSLLESEDADVRVHAVKVVANLAAEEANQEKIVEAGGLKSLLVLLGNSEDETIRRVAAGAIANLAMNEKNQELIMGQGGITLLATTANEAEDPQTLRMVAGAIANLCGNETLQVKLRDEGGIKALLGMVRTRHPDVLAQVARGIANFAKCESRAVSQSGHRVGRSLLIEDGALPWIVANANNESSPIRRHIELALCHLAQHEVNARDLATGGALWELVRISRECSREDIRNLAQKTLNASSVFQAELRRLHVSY